MATLTSRNQLPAEHVGTRRFPAPAFGPLVRQVCAILYLIALVSSCRPGDEDVVQRSTVPPTTKAEGKATHTPATAALPTRAPRAVSQATGAPDRVQLTLEPDEDDYEIPDDETWKTFDQVRTDLEKGAEM